MTEQRRIAEAFHLSTMLQDELEARGMTLNHLAAAMGTDDEYGFNFLTLLLIWSVHDVKSRAGDKTLRKIAVAFGLQFEYLKNLENGWHDWMELNGLTRQIPPREVTDEAEAAARIHELEAREETLDELEKHLPKPDDLG